MRDLFGAIPRATFLACSWTWCIGMFLPVFLIGDFGVWGWVAFAIPNVLGAMAVGLIVRTPHRSRAIVERHSDAMRLFSLITIVFHLYFLGQILRVINPSGTTIGTPWLSPVFVVVVAAIAWALSRLHSRGWMFAAVATFALSILAAILMQRTSGGPALAPPPDSGVFATRQLLWMAPALCFGFLLCPHLDLTFHRTRQESPGRAGDLAFILGFGVFFLALIVFTLAYAASFMGQAWISYWIALHFAAQSAFTMGAHWRELRARPMPREWLIALGAFALLALPWPIGGFRLGYDLILFAYAIPFPAYVWIVMIPRRPSRRRETAAWLTSVLIASPIFAVGYLGQEWWLIPIAIAIPLLAPLVESRLGSGLEEPS